MFPFRFVCECVRDYQLDIFIPLPANEGIHILQSSHWKEQSRLLRAFETVVISTMVRRQMNVPLPLSRWLACIAMMALTARTASGTQVDTSSSSSSHGGLRSILPQQEQLRFNRTVLPDPFERLERYREYSREESENRKIRMRDQRERARAFLKKIPQPDPSKLERVEPAEFEEITADRKSRGLNWLGGDDVESSNPLADPSQYYDKWAQAYRMLGAFIDCDHPKQSNNNHRSRDGNNQKEGNSNACARWMMWAAVRLIDLVTALDL